MCGVSDETIMTCPYCKERTVHITDWESEAPNELFVTCTECNKSRTERTRRCQMSDQMYEKYLLSVVANSNYGRYYRELAARELFKLELRRNYATA